MEQSISKVQPETKEPQTETNDREEERMTPSVSQTKATQERKKYGHIYDSVQLAALLPLSFKLRFRALSRGLKLIENLQCVSCGTYSLDHEVYNQVHCIDHICSDS